MYGKVQFNIIKGALGGVHVRERVSLISDYLIPSCFIGIWIWPFVSFFPFTTKILRDIFLFRVASLFQNQYIPETIISGWQSAISTIPFWNDSGWFYLHLPLTEPCCSLFYSCNTTCSVLVWSLELAWVIVMCISLLVWKLKFVMFLICFLVFSGHGNWFLFHLISFSLFSFFICMDFRWRIVCFGFNWCDG